MAFPLELPAELETQGWKVKIRDKERVEPPHVSVIKKTQTWRWGLRERAFLDERPPARDVPGALVEHIQAHVETLTAEWDKMYPHNKVISEDEA